MKDLRSDSIEWTIKRSCFGSPVVYVRTTYPSGVIGCWSWGRWRKANLSEQNAALIKLVEMNK